jgi:hypothetical protein
MEIENIILKDRRQEEVENNACFYSFLEGKK